MKWLQTRIEWKEKTARSAIMTTACFQICYANMSLSASPLPINFYKFRVCFLRMQSWWRDSKVLLVTVKVPHCILYLDFQLAQRHLNHWKLPSEDWQLEIDLRLDEHTSFPALLCHSQVGGSFLKTPPEMKKERLHSWLWHTNTLDSLN